MIIYKLTFPNGKSYIGQTVRMLSTRISQHRTQMRANSLLPVHCAWRKHGEPVVSNMGVYGDMDALHAAEISFIRDFNTVAPFGYNLSAGGETAPSKNPYVAAKISAKGKGRLHSVETKKAMAIASKANWENPEYRAKVDAAVRASWTPEARAAAGERARGRNLGKVHSEETKAKLRDRVVTDETRAKMSIAAKSRIREVRSPETRAKIAANTKASWLDPELTARRLAAIRVAKNDPDKAEIRSAKAASSWQNPEIRERRIAAIRAAKAFKKSAKE